MAKVDLMSEWTKTEGELKNEGLSIALEELGNNADEYIAGKKSVLNRAKTALKSAKMASSKSGDFGKIVDAEISVELAKAEYDKAVAIRNKYFEDAE